jgi:hypothetical protein
VDSHTHAQKINVCPYLIATKDSKDAFVLGSRRYVTGSFLMSGMTSSYLIFGWMDEYEG